MTAKSAPKMTPKTAMKRPHCEPDRSAVELPEKVAGNCVANTCRPRVYIAFFAKKSDKIFKISYIVIEIQLIM